MSPSDHTIADLPAFHAAIEAGRAAAEAGASSPSESSPTIRDGFATSPPAGNAVRRVEHFIEKPDLDHAKALLASGGHYGTRAFPCPRGRPGLARSSAMSRPIAHAAQAATTPRRSPMARFARGTRKSRASPAQSIDYAVMKGIRGSVVPVSMGWSDIGIWQALLDAAVRDAAGTACRRPRRARQRRHS